MAAASRQCEFLRSLLRRRYCLEKDIFFSPDSSLPGTGIGNIKRFRREWDDLLSPTVKKKASIRIDVCSGVKVPSVPVSTALHWAFFSPSVTSQSHAELLGTVIVVAPLCFLLSPCWNNTHLKAIPPQLLSVVAKTLDLSKEPRRKLQHSVDCW